MPANFRKAGKTFKSKNGLVNYRYGGRTVPGMFKDGGLPKAQQNLNWQELFNQRQRSQQVERDFGHESVHSGVTPEKRSFFGRVGANIGNWFRPKARDVDPIYKGQLKHPYLSNPYHGIDQTETWGPGRTNVTWPSSTGSGTTSGGFGSTTGGPREFIRKRGGSTGPNGML